MRSWLALLACMALGACYSDFTSDTPLYPESAGRCPVAEAAVFASVQVDAGGALRRNAESSIGPYGARCIQRDLSEPGTDSQKGLFIHLAGDWHIVQLGEPPQAHSAYTLARYDGARILLYSPMCSDFTDEALAQAGVERRKSGEDSQERQCVVTRAEQVETLFRAWIALERAPTTYLVRVDAS